MKSRLKGRARILLYPTEKDPGLAVGEEGQIWVVPAGWGLEKQKGKDPLVVRVFGSCGSQTMRYQREDNNDGGSQGQPEKSPRRERTLADLLGIEGEEARQITLRDILLEAVEEVRRREREKVDRERDEG